MQVIIDGLGTDAILLHRTIEAAMDFKLPDGSIKAVHVIYNSRHDAPQSYFTLLPDGEFAMQGCLAYESVLIIIDF